MFWINRAKWIDAQKTQKGLYKSKLYWILSYFRFCNYWTYFNFCFCFFAWYSYRNDKLCNFLKICAVAAGIKTYKSIIKKNKKGHSKIVLLAKSKLTSIEVLIFKALIDSNISDCNWARTQNHLVLKRTLNHLAKLAKWLSEFTLHTCLNIKELLAWSRRKICKLRDSNWSRSQNHLVFKRTLKHLTKLAKWLSCVLSTYMYGAFDCMFLSCHVRISEWIHTL